MIEFIKTHPRISIVVISFIVTFLITLINHLLIDKEKMKKINEKQKRLKEEMKKHRNNPQKMAEINKQLMEDLPEQLKMSFKPMLVTLIPIIIFFKWLRMTFADTSLASTWFWWYIGASIFFSVILRKFIEKYF